MATTATTTTSHSFNGFKRPDSHLECTVLSFEYYADLYHLVIGFELNTSYHHQQLKH